MTDVLYACALSLFYLYACAVLTRACMHCLLYNTNTISTNDIHQENTQTDCHLQAKLLFFPCGFMTDSCHERNKPYTRNTYRIIVFNNVLQAHERGSRSRNRMFLPSARLRVRRRGRRRHRIIVIDTPLIGS